MKKLLIALLTSKKKAVAIPSVALSNGPGCPMHDAPLAGGIQRA